MPNIKIGSGYVNIPSSINTRASLEKIIKRIKLANFETKPPIKTKKARGGSK